MHNITLQYLQQIQVNHEMMLHQAKTDQTQITNLPDSETVLKPGHILLIHSKELLMAHLPTYT